MVKSINLKIKMHKLHLIRHADAPMSFGIDDKDRPLSDYGITQAKSITTHLECIDHVLCSSAVRTKMTAQALMKAGVEFGKIDYLDEIYNAPMGALLKALQTTEAANILIIAHNPGIHALANFLAHDDGSSKIEKLKIFYSPATLSILECDIANWEDIQPNQNTLTHLITPK